MVHPFVSPGPQCHAQTHISGLGWILGPFAAFHRWRHCQVWWAAADQEQPVAAGGEPREEGKAVCIRLHTHAHTHTLLIISLNGRQMNLLSDGGITLTAFVFRLGTSRRLQSMNGAATSVWFRKLAASSQKLHFPLKSPAPSTEWFLTHRQIHVIYVAVVNTLGGRSLTSVSWFHLV